MGIGQGGGHPGQERLENNLKLFLFLLQIFTCAATKQSPKLPKGKHFELFPFFIANFYVRRY